MTVKAGPYLDFISAFFHRFNNLLGGIYGKLELIVVYQKEETKKKLSPEEVSRFLGAMRQLRSWMVSSDAVGIAMRFLSAKDESDLGDFFQDRQGRFLTSLKEAERDASLKDQILVFLNANGAAFPQAPETLAPEALSEIFKYAENLLTFSRDAQSRWFDASGAKML